MADNITAPATGAVLATDEIASIHYPRNKLGFGADGSYTDVSTAAPFPVADQAVASAISTLAEAIGGGGSGGDASAANQTTEIALLNAIGAAITGTLTIALPAGAATNAGIASALTGLTFYPPTQPISAVALPLPSGAATSAKQDAALAAIALIGTRAYAAPATRLAAVTADAATTGLNATEVLLHASTRCFVRAGAAATTNDIPLEIGEKFHMRLTAGQQIHVIRDTVDGFLNVVPVA